MARLLCPVCFMIVQSPAPAAAAAVAEWLLVHDADETECWLEQGFRLIEPPADVPEDEAVLVLAWGELLEDVYALLQGRGLSWHLERHRYPSRHANEE